MENPTICHSINKNILKKEDGVRILDVNPIPASTIHIQRAYTDSSTTAVTSKWVTEPYGTQYTSTAPLRTVNKRFEVNTNVAGLVIQVELELVNGNNDIEYVTLTTNGTSYVATTNATYKVCNDMRILSNYVLTGTQRVWCRAQSGTNNNIFYVVLGETFKYNPVFMVGRLNGITRKATLLGFTDIRTNTGGSIKATIWTNNSATWTSRLYLDLPANANSRISVPKDGLLTLGIGEWVLWNRNTGVSVNTTCSINAKWRLDNVS
jgi:hypothetical protein